MANYPDWVKQFREKGTAVKKVGNTYYLYKHSSRRVPGKKHPQATDEYIGVVTPAGVIKRNRKKVSVENVDVYEYGFSKALCTLCPEEWKKALREDWKEVLLAIVSRHSPNSYLLKDQKPKSVNRNISLQEEKLNRMLPCPINKLECLATVYILHFEERASISRIREEQRILIDSLGIELEVE